MAKAKKATKSAKAGKASKAGKAVKKAKPAKAVKKVKAKSPAKAAKVKPVAKKAAKPAAAKKKVVAKAPKKAAKKAAPAVETKVKAKSKENSKVKAKEEQKIVQVDVVAPEVAEIVEEEVVLTDAEGRRYCRAADCDQISMVDGYCRYHYLLYWKRIQNRKKILAGGKLERYIDELTSRYADKFIEILRKDLRSEKDFMIAIQELELDEDSSNNEEQDEEETKTYLEEIRGISSDDSSVGDDDY